MGINWYLAISVLHTVKRWCERGVCTTSSGDSQADGIIEARLRANMAEAARPYIYRVICVGHSSRLYLADGRFVGKLTPKSKKPLQHILDYARSS
jgi:hypothetical protein